MNKFLFIHNLKKYYNNSAVIFESIFDKYSFTFYKINDLERVYVVEDSFIVYFGVKRIQKLNKDFFKYHFTDQYRQIPEILGHVMIVEELTYNELLKINASKLKRDIFGKQHSYAPFIYKFFNGQKDRPVRNLNSLEEKHFNNGQLTYLQSNFNVVDKKLPCLKLADRINNWKGFPHTFIIYQVKYLGKTGYAVNETSSPYITKFILNSIREFEKSIRNRYFENQKDATQEINSNFYEIITHNEYIHYRFPYAIREILGEELCYNDANFKNILTSLLDDYYTQNNSNIKKCSECHPKFIPNNVLSYCFFTDYVKSSFFPTKYIEILKDPQTYISRSNNVSEYVKTENRWKSEELVYEYTKKLFNKHKVIYQHRPYFLHTQNGQMSYDVFVCGENIAIEYQGKQHFEPVEFFGGQKHFEEQTKRDEIKRNKSEENNIILIYVNYWEDISLDLIKNKVAEEYKKRGITKNTYYLR